MRGIFLFLAALLLVGGCIDFREITEPGEESRPARLEALLVYQEPVPRGERRGVAVSALLDPGTDGEGWPRRVEDDALYVGGVRILPVRTHRDGRREYDGWLPVQGPASGGVVLSISAPAVGREGRLPVAYEIAGVRIGADSLEVEPGEELRLPFAREQSSWVLPGEESWQLSVHGEGARWDTSGVRFPPSPLVVSAAALPDDSGGWASARLILQRRIELGRAGRGGYLLEIRSVTDLAWAVRRAAGSAAR